MAEAITVTTAVKFRRWRAPNYAEQDTPAKPRKDGSLGEGPKAHVSDLPHQVLDALALAWLDDLYAKSLHENPFRSHR